MADLGPTYEAFSVDDLTEAGMHQLTIFLVLYITYSPQVAFTPAFNAGLD